jgi:hypothetical protein
MSERNLKERGMAGVYVSFSTHTIYSTVTSLVQFSNIVVDKLVIKTGADPCIMFTRII